MRGSTAGYQEESGNMEECSSGRSWSHRMSCKVEAGTGEESVVCRSCNHRIAVDTNKDTSRTKAREEDKPWLLTSSLQPLPPIGGSQKEPIWQGSGKCSLQKSSVCGL